jgi:minor extracellular serine protease Vpr
MCHLGTNPGKARTQAREEAMGASTGRRALARTTIFALLLAAFPFAIPAIAADVEELAPIHTPPSVGADDGVMYDETGDLWFVELASRPAVEGTPARQLEREQANFRSVARREGVAFQERAAFRTLWNGLSVRVEPSELGELRRLPGVAGIYPVATVQIPDTDTADPDMATALAMTGADVAQSELGLSGDGIRVAVMDTGIDYQHPDLGGAAGATFPTDRVVAGYDFVGDDFNAQIPGSVPVPDDDPMDCNGHGTHVAGIVGADAASAAGVTGVAPGVEFGAYKVFGCDGSTTADVMIAAMEMALDDQMHVLNMSIGSAFQWPQYPTATAADLLVDEGMVVVASIGNSGANGVYSAGAPGLGASVIGVASYDNTQVSLNSFTISPDDAPIGYGTAAASPQPPTSGSLPMTRTGTVTSPDDACAPIAADLGGTAALIRRGTCPFHDKALNAQNAGAAAVVLYNNVAGRFSPTVAGTPPITIPVVAISDVEGALIDSRLASGPVTMTWTEEQLVSTNPAGGLISSFSSYGLSPDLDLKPDIGAPGGLIRSTYPLALGGYATVSGTSMSAPHVAGGVALLLEAAPGTPAHDVRGMLQNTADPKPWWGNPGLGFLDNVHRQGAGMLDIPGAIQATTSVTPSKLALGESEAGPATRTLTIANDGDEAVTYTLSHVAALSTGGSTFEPGFFVGGSSATFDPASVTVGPGASADVQVTITPPAAPDLGQYGGYLVFTGDNDSVSRVPFAGFIGDYQAIQALTPTPFGLPWLASLEGDTYINRPDGWTFSLKDGDRPYVLLHLDHQVQELRMEARDVRTGRLWNRGFEFQYLPRNSTPTGFFAFDGLISRGRGAPSQGFPNGTYVIELSVLKALGDRDNPDHWETWTSPPITISRR